MHLYQNNNRKSPRAQWWDYTRSAAYYVTICTKNRIHYLGKIENEEMHLSPIGNLAERFWFEIVNHVHHVELGAFQVMPNHIHGILIINKNREIARIDDCIDRNVEIIDPAVLPTSLPSVGTRHALSLPMVTTNKNSLQQTEPGISPGKKRFQNPGKNSLSSIMGSYKSAITKHANLLHLEFGWQYRFYDHIIHDKNSYYRIEQYIYNNVKNWGDDRFYNKYQSDQ